MKVLQIGKFYPIRGGVEKLMWDLTEGLGEAGVIVDMLCAKLPSEGVDDKDTELVENTSGFFPRKTLILRIGPSARVICVPALLKFAATMISPAMVFTLRRMLIKARADGEPYDVIHIHHPDPMAAAALRLCGWKGKVVLHYHSDILRQKHLMRCFEPLQKWLLRRSDIIVGTTPVYMKESHYLQDFQEKTTCLPIGIKPLAASSEEAARLRAGFGDKKIIWSLGRLVEYKGYEYLIGAMQYLPDDYELVIGGEGPLRPRLEQTAEKAGVKARVHLVGRIGNKDCADWFAACDVFVLSSILRTEAFGIVQIEAMSMGKPVISTRIPGSGVSWVNDDGKSGLTVPVRDSLSIARAVEKICSSSAEYGCGALERYEKLFTFDRMIKGCMEIYEGL